MSAVTSRANSRTPSRGASQDLEVFKPVSRQGSQGIAAVNIPASQFVSRQGSQSITAEKPAAQSSRALQGEPPKFKRVTSALKRQPSAAAHPVAEGITDPADTKHSSFASSDSFTSFFLDVAAAQPSRSASSATLNAYHSISTGLANNPANMIPARYTPDTTWAPHNVSSMTRHCYINGHPIAEGTEERPSAPNKNLNGARSIPKNSMGFMSGASTGRGKAPKPAVLAPVVKEAEEEDARDDMQLQLLPGALAVDSTIDPE